MSSEASSLDRPATTEIRTAAKQLLAYVMRFEVYTESDTFHSTGISTAELQRCSNYLEKCRDEVAATLRQLGHAVAMVARELVKVLDKLWDACLTETEKAARRLGWSSEGRRQKEVAKALSALEREIMEIWFPWRGLTMIQTVVKELEPRFELAVFKKRLEQEFDFQELYERHREQLGLGRTPQVPSLDHFRHHTSATLRLLTCDLSLGQQKRYKMKTPAGVSAGLIELLGRE